MNHHRKDHLQTIKMAELIHLNPHFLHILARLGVKLGFEDKNVEAVCSMHSINLGFFLSLARLHLGGLANIEEPTSKQQLTQLIGYLKESHSYYLSIKLPQLKLLIAAFAETVERAPKELLNKFWTDYENEVREHMWYENNTIFPLVEQVVAGADARSKLGSFEQFEENHEDIAEALLDLKNLLIKYFPPTEKEEARRAILLELFDLEADLKYHQEIENSLLVPMVKHYTQQKITR
jgi:regulator of cell morphogenesis and NO signaling